MMFDQAIIVKRKVFQNLLSLIYIWIFLCQFPQILQVYILKSYMLFVSRQQFIGCNYAQIMNCYQKIGAAIQNFDGVLQVHYRIQPMWTYS